MEYSEDQEQLENIIQSMIVSGMMFDIPVMEYSTIELSVIPSQIKTESAVTTAICTPAK